MKVVQESESSTSDEEFLAGAYVASTIAVDTEGTDTEKTNYRDGTGHGFGVSIAYRDMKGKLCSRYFPIAHSAGNVAPHIRELLAGCVRTHRRIVFHNAKFDLVSLMTMEIEVPKSFYCTMMMAAWIDENLPSKGLDYLSKRVLGRPGKQKSDLFQALIKSIGWHPNFPAPVMALYASTDAEDTLLLDEVMYPEFQRLGFDMRQESLGFNLWERETRFIRLMNEIEINGIEIDKPFCRNELARGLSEMERVRVALGVNPGSKKDLEKLLLVDLGLPPSGQVTKTGAPSFDKKAMEFYDELLSAMGNPTADMILTYRGWQKSTSSNYSPYLEKCSPDGRLRPNYKLHGTRTGRMSCEDPNLMQIPRYGSKPWNGHLKMAFHARRGFENVTVDYSQLEFRLAAAYANEVVLMDAFNDPNRDVFWEMAYAIFGSNATPEQRQQCKTLTYTKLFGGGLEKVAMVLGQAPHETRPFYREWENRYSRLVKKSREVNSIAAKRAANGNGFIRYWSGRIRHFDEVSEARKAFNSLIQGGGAEIMKSAMLRVRERVVDENCRLVLQVHDSITAEIREDMVLHYTNLIQHEMEAVHEEYDFKVRFATAAEIWGNDELTKQLFAKAV